MSASSSASEQAACHARTGLSVSACAGVGGRGRGKEGPVKTPVGRTGTPYEPGSLSLRHGKPGSASGR